MNKATYVTIGKPLKFIKMELYSAPLGMYRLDILKRKIKENKEFRSKFSKQELKQIKEAKE